MMLGAVAGGRPCPPRALSPQWELGSPSVVPSTSNSRLGRKSSVAQGRGRMEMKAVGIDVSKDRLDVHVFPRGDDARRGGGGLPSALRPSSPFPLLDAAPQSGRSFRKRGSGRSTSKYANTSGDGRL